MAKRNLSNRKSKGAIERKPKGKKTQKTTYLILCEGEKTEPIYFEALKKYLGIDRSDKVSVRVEGLGNNTLSLVRAAISRIESPNYSADHIWVVMDRDIKRDNPGNNKQQFNQALKNAAENKIKVAYSIDAFEIWFLLHFDFYTSRTPRDKYFKKLEEKLGKKYEKNESIFDDIAPMLETAIRNANKLLEECDTIAYDCNPSTTVHLLVKELQQYKA